MKPRFYFLTKCVLIAFALIHCKAQAGIGDYDAYGWTTLTPSTDSILMYVSSSEGNNANDGLTPETPKATIAAANAYIRNGYPDWILLKRGDTFPPTTLGRWKSGRSAEEPMVLTYYGDSGPRPVIQLTGIFVNWDGEAKNHVAFVGLDFHRAISDPDAPEFTNTSSQLAFRCVSLNTHSYNLLIEDCRMRYCGVVIQGSNQGTAYLNNVHLRRNIIMNTWRHNSTTSDAIELGIFISAAVDIYLEENLFHHNGWSSVIEGAGANQFNHNVYMQTTNGGEIIVNGNILSYGSAHGIQLRSGGHARMNAMVGNAIGMNIGYTSFPSIYVGQTIVDDNVVTDGRPQIPNDFTNPQSSALWGIWKQSINNVSASNNIVANIKDSRGGNMRPYNDMTANQFGVGNIGWNWVNTNFPGTNPGWLDPSRNADSYAQTLDMEDWEEFIDAAANRGVREMPYELSAFAYVNYIREGFNKDAVEAPFLFYTGGGSEDWHGYTVTNGWVDTGAWMGWLYVVNEPWLYREDIGWIYEGSVEADGGWMYAIK